MGVEKYKLESDVYQNLSEACTNKKWTGYLIVCSLIVCLSSFQFGYNIGSVNTITPLVRDYFEQSYFKEKFFDKAKLLQAGELKLEAGKAKFAAGMAKFTEGKDFLESKEKLLLEAEDRRDNYLDTMFSFDPIKIAAAKKFKAEKEKEIEEKYNTTVEIFMTEARKKINAGKVKLADGRQKLDDAAIQIENGTAKIEAGRIKLIAGRKKLDIVGDIMWSFFNVLFVVGGMIGAFTAKHVTDRFGHKHGILFHYVFTVIGALFTVVPFYTGTPKLAGLFVKIGRLFYGVQGGMSCILIPSYLSEISPFGLRGKIGNLHTQSLAFGILVSQVLGFSQLLGTPDLWHLVLGVPLIPALLGGVLLLIVVPDSPAVLIGDREEAKARNVLMKLRGVSNVNGEVQLICKEIADADDGEKIRFMDVIDNRSFRWPVICAVILQVAQQICGVQVVFFYSSILFATAGVPSGYLQYAIILTGLVNFLALLVFMPLVSGMSRKKLLVSTMILMIVDLICLVIFMQLHYLYGGCILPFFSVACILIFLVLFAAGLGPIPCMFLDECFQKDSRSSPTFLCIMANFVTALLVTINFPFLIKLLGGYTFLTAAGFLALTIILVFLKVPETRGRSAKEIQGDFD